MRKLLIANRGEIAIRIARSAADLGIATVAVHAADDALALHVAVADEAAALPGEGPAAYLDAAGLLMVAKAHGCDAVHPGYGFLSESAAFASACADAGVTFVGPAPETLALFGDKAAARAAAKACEVPTAAGIDRSVSLEEAVAFMKALGPGQGVMLKALAGGGGRGMRAVERPEDLAEAFERCASEARAAFGSGELYVESLAKGVRHVEVQVVGDASGAVSHLWDRECSLQRQRQKLVEIAPAFGLPESTREAMLTAAVRLARHAKVRGLCTIEFLVRDDGGFVFMEANPRIQVEHTVTEAVLGIDLVAAQLRIADGASLADPGLAQDQVPPPQGSAVQVRVNTERMGADGIARPTCGTIEVYEPPSGPGVRVDGYAYTGYETSPRYDSLLAKVIAHGPDLPTAIGRARRALAEFRIEGVETNAAFLQALLKSPALTERRLHTGYVDEHMIDLMAAAGERPRYFTESSEGPQIAGAAIDLDDPLAVLAVRAPAGGSEAQRRSARAQVAGPPGTAAVDAPMQGTVIALLVGVGDLVRKGQPVAVLEALKMEHAIPAAVAGLVREIVVGRGMPIHEGTPLMFIEPGEVEGGDFAPAALPEPDHIRSDLAKVQHFHALTGDAARTEQTARRHAAGKRTARENIADLCDPDSFMEYGPMVLPHRRGDENAEELAARMLKAPGDGLVMGIGRVNGELFGPEGSRCVALSYDYSVFAGTQGRKNHVKTDRMLELAAEAKLPVVFFTEGGGGRTFQGYPGDPPPAPTTTGGLRFGLWRHLGKLSGLVPTVGITSGNCFAGNAVVLGACDLIVATRDSTIGIGGPAMIEGGGLGRYAPEEVGPVSVQEPNGVIDIVVEDEAQAVATAKRYLGYFQGRTEGWTAPDQRLLRHMVPEDRRAPYDVRQVIATLADEDSVLELRPRFGLAMVTALVRVEGRPLGIIANNCVSPTGGAIDSDAADKASRFMQLCDAFDIPLLSLLDVPGNMVGPEAEKEATVRHCGRMYVAGANLTVPTFCVVLRKAYGLGALAMTGGGFHVPMVVVSWPTGEFAGMGLEGQIKLGRRAELAAIEDIPQRKARYEEMLVAAYDWAGALNGATVFEFDDAIDPADTRRWLAMGLEAAPKPQPRATKKYPFVDTW